MKFLNKKIATVALMGSIVVSGALTGCSSTSSSSSKDSQTTITVWGMGEEAKSLPKIAKAFEQENPKIHVEVQALPWDKAHDKLLTAVASKQGPDVVQMGTTWIPEFASAGSLMDITSDTDKYPDLAAKNFFDGSVDTTKYDNKTVGVPWYIDTRVLYYRTDLLKKVGYDQAPKTWDELRDAAMQLKERGGNNYGISIDANEQSLAFMFARQNGSKLLDGKKPLFNQKEFVDAVKYMDGFFKDGSAPKNDIGLDAIAAFKGDGVVPMFISGPWMVKLINDQAPELKGKWATAVLPSKENNMSSLGGSDLSVFQYTKHKDAALKFVAFMSKPKTQLQWLKLVNAMPATKRAWEDPALQNDQNLKVFGDQMKNAQPMPVITQFENIAQTFLKSNEQIFRGGADVQKTMDDFNKKAEGILSKK